MLLRGTLGIFFSEFSVYTPVQEWSLKSKKHDLWNLSFRKIVFLGLPLNGIRQKITCSTDTRKENAWNFYQNFPSTSQAQKWDFKKRKRDLNFRKYTILWVLQGGVQRKMVRSIGITQKNIWNLFQILLLIFRKMENVFLAFHL